MLYSKAGGGKSSVSCLLSAHGQRDDGVGVFFVGMRPKMVPVMLVFPPFVAETQANRAEENLEAFLGFLTLAQSLSVADVMAERSEPPIIGSKKKPKKGGAYNSRNHED